MSDRKTYRPPEDTQYFETTVDASGKPWDDTDWDWAPFFEPREFACKCGCGKVKISAEFMDKLWDLRREMDTPFIIRSGYRCEKHNRKVGGEDNSMHLHGIAADVSVLGMNRKQMYREAELEFAGIGCYNDQNGAFIHLDTGTYARWGDIGEFITKPFVTESKPQAERKKENIGISAGTLVSSAPAVLNSVGGLDLPQYVIAPAFVLGLAVIGVFLWRKFK